MSPVPLLGISPTMVVVPVLAIGALLMVGAFAAIGAANQPATQCTAAHTPSAAAPTSLISAAHYLTLGDYDYDRGACIQAIDDYTRAIKLDTEFAAAYNNRAYTRMRQQDYAAALPDLDRAIALRPDYVNALGGASGTSVCGHRMLAYNDGWNAGWSWACSRAESTMAARSATMPLEVRRPSAPPCNALASRH